MTSAHSTPTPHHHPFPLQSLAPHLLPHLPHSLPLLRRLQHTPQSPTSIALATFPSLPPGPPYPAHFAALYADRARAPETECWIFSTFESGRRSSGGQFDQQGFRARRNILALLGEVESLGREEEDGSRFMVVGTLNEDLLGVIGGEEVWGLKAEKVLVRDRYSDRAGNWLERERERVGKRGGKGEGVVAGTSVVYQKWITAPALAPGAPTSISERPEKVGGEGECGNGGDVLEGIGMSKQKRTMAPCVSTDPKALPEGYSFSKVRREELPIVISRTDIPQTEGTLSRLGCVALRYRTGHRTASPEAATEKTAERREEEDAHSGDLIAWAFLGVDGSLKSLHVEPQHRGKGLAKAMTRKLLEKLARDPLSMGIRPLEADTLAAGVKTGAGWAHADVMIDNLESAGVVRGLGGKEGWRVRWVSVDLKRVGMVLEEMR